MAAIPPLNQLFDHQFPIGNGLTCKPEKVWFGSNREEVHAKFPDGRRLTFVALEIQGEDGAEAHLVEKSEFVRFATKLWAGVVQETGSDEAQRTLHDCEVQLFAGKQSA